MVLSNSTLKDCEKLSMDYLVEHEGSTSEFDMSINGISRQKIIAMKKEFKTCFLGTMNLYGEERKKEYKLTEYTGQKIYNFEYTFCIPCHDIQIEKMINERDKSPYTGTKEDTVRIESIVNRIEELKGAYLFWS